MDCGITAVEEARMCADLGIDLHGVGIALHVGKSHARAKSEGTDIVGSGGISLLHCELHVGDSRPVVVQTDLNAVLVHRNVGRAAAGMNDHIDLTLIHRNGNLTNGLGRNSQLAKVLFYTHRCLTRGAEVLAVNTEMKIYSFTHRFSPFLQSPPA